MGDLANPLMGGALAQANQNESFADRHDIATFDAGAGEVFIGIAEPDFEIRAFEKRVKLVNRPLKERLRLSGKPIHWIAGNPVVDPARGVTLKKRVGNWWDQE